MRNAIVRACVAWTLSVAALSILIPAAAYAQGTDATITGQVLDESGAALPGVTVTVSGSALQLRNVSEPTGAHGEYRITSLPPGTYSVEYSLQGFQTVRNEELRLTTSFVAKLDVTMKVGSVSESVTVTAQSPVVDVKTTSSGATLTQEFLDSIPTGRFGMAGLLTMTPGARTNLDFGQFSFTETTYHAFGRDGNSWPMIEGVPVASAFNSGQGLANRLLYEAVEESQVQTIGSPAETPSSGIRMNVVTKSGGNDFHGGASLTQFAHWMQSNNVDSALSAQGIVATGLEQRSLRSGEFGGRLVRDKLWFYAAARSRADVTPIAGFLKPDGSQGYNTSKQPMWSAKLSYQMTPAQRLIFWNQWEYREQDAASATRFYDYDSRGDHKNNTNTRKIEYQLVRGNKIFTALAGSNTLEAGPYPSLSPNPSTVDQVTQKVTGGENKVGVGNGYFRYAARGTFSWYKADGFHGNHDVKSGLDYTWGEGNNFTGNRDIGNYILVYRSGVPFQLNAQNNPSDPHNKIAYTGAYAQDSWSLNRRLTLNLGVRFAHDRAYLPNQCRDAAPAPFSGLYPAACFSQFEVTPFNSFVPRLHAAFDLTGDGKTVAKGGWGRFANMHGAEEVTLANQLADITTVFTWHDLNGDRLWQPGESNLNTNGPDFISSQLSTNAALIGLVNNDNLKVMGSNEFSGSIERQLIANFGVRVSGIYSKDFNTIRVANPLRPYSSYNIPVTNPDPGADGRVGTADDPGTTLTYYDYAAALRGSAFQQTQFINDSSSDASYKSFEIAFNKRYSSKWQMLASYSGTKSNIPFIPDITGQKAVVTTTYNPNAEIFARNTTYEWQTRISGSYLLPLDIQFSANFTSQSGAQLARTVSVTGGKQITSMTLRTEPIGSITLDTLNLLTLRAEKKVRFIKTHSATVGFQIYNVMNSNAVTAMTVQSGPNYGKPTGIVDPRVGEFTLSYRF
ncbi:MAG: hypothetical protein JWL71_3825 [Acidobacteria bacterium]|nr:hypothetical protein [Acidobacteriota bacterium]